MHLLSWFAARTMDVVPNMRIQSLRVEFTNDRMELISVAAQKIATKRRQREHENM